MDQAKPSGSRRGRAPKRRLSSSPHRDDEDSADGSRENVGAAKPAEGNAGDSEESGTQRPSKLLKEDKQDEGKAQQSGQGKRSAFDRYDCIHTRPKDWDKKGACGIPTEIITNYFMLQLKMACRFRLHRVDFSPELENTKVCKALLRTRESDTGPYLFDGTMLFTTMKQLGDAENPMRLENVHFPNAPENSYVVTIKFVNEVGPLDPMVFQLYNILIRKCQANVGFDLLGRYYFDRQSMVPFSAHKIELWPGFLASMRQQETNAMLRVDLTFKALRTESVFEQMKEIRRSFPHEWKEKCEADIIGTTVMTRYNRKTYKISGIVWDQTPLSTFTVKAKKDFPASEVAYKTYFATKHQTQIQCEIQPMLKSSPSRQDIRRGNTTDIILVPELCFRTGLTQEMRENFGLMRQLANELHQPPAERLRKIKGFVSRLLQSGTVFVVDNMYVNNLSTEFLTNKICILGCD
jgi:aubergine-like protein